MKSKKSVSMDDTTKETERQVWVICGVNEQQKAVHKGLKEAVRAYADSQNSNRPIIGFRPQYTQK